MTKRQILRLELKTQIDKADSKLLRRVKAILDIETTKDDDTDEWLEEISEAEKKAIQLSFEKIKKDGGIPHSEAIKQLIWYPK